MAAVSFADNWMERLPDNLYVCQVSLPGAHDAATGNGFGTGLGAFGEPYARTQDISLARQWGCGVRAFDLRPCSYEGYLNVNHGIVPTSVRFEDALYLLRDSLIANPSEFAVVHLRHESEGDQVKGAYETLLLELLHSDGLKDYLVDFRRDLTVADMRGKILLLSRDKYAAQPVGGFFSNWCGWIDWAAQTQGQITGAGTGTSAVSPLYVQDFSDTHNAGDVDAKVTAINRMLDFSTTNVMKTTGKIVWVFNFASAYSKVVSLLGNTVSTSDGYRDNATHTNAAIIDYLRTHDAGPTGVILMDYAGVDESGAFATKGKELVDALITNNFNYLDRINPGLYETLVGRLKAVDVSWTKAKDQMLTECADVAAEFDKEMQAMRDTIDRMREEVERLYASRHLTENYSIGTNGVSVAIRNLLKKAVEAQAEYDLTNGISSVADGGEQIVQVYSLGGERLDALRSHCVNLVRYANGEVKKIRCE